jgi:hypothetical protein
MIDPAGPLPPAVYWRRRVIAVSGTVAAVVLLAWIIGRLVGGADSEPVRGSSARALAPLSARPTPASSSASPVASSSAAVPAPAAASPAPPPLPCPDTAIGVSAQPGAPSYRVGQRPLLTLVITNTGALPCVRDVSRASRELVIMSQDGATRLWSSNDCYSAPGADSRLLGPGERLSFTVSWAGRTSGPGCPSRRRTLPAGTYLLVPRLGPITGAPVPLQLT